MPRSTPDALLRFETGRVHLELQIFKRLISWWVTLLKMGNDRIPRMCYNRLYSIHNCQQIPFNWCSYLRCSLEKIGAVHLWESNNYIEVNKNKNNLVNAYKCHLVSIDINKIYNTKYNSFIRFVTTFDNRESYIRLNIPFEFIKIIAQVRLVNHKFPRIIVNNIKYEFKPESDCVLCSDNFSDTIIHLLLECKFFAIYRSKYLNKFCFTNEHTELDKLDLILNCTTLYKIKYLCTYLKKCLTIRNNIVPWLRSSH